MRQVRRAGQAHRRASELERATNGAGPDGQAMAMSPKYRGRAWRRQLIFDAVFAIVLAFVIVALAKIAFGFL